MSERDEQVALFDALKTFNVTEANWLFAIPNGGQRHIAVATRMKAEGVKSGVWDLFLPIPRGDYHGLFIEMKYNKRKLTDNQRVFGAYVKEHGYATAIAYTWIEAKDIIEKYLEGTL